MVAFEFEDDDFYMDDWSPEPFIEDTDETRLKSSQLKDYEAFYNEKAPNLLPEDLPRRVNHKMNLIAAVRGDDFAAVLNNAEYGIAYLDGMQTQGLKISWKDVGFSHIALSYAQSIILIPPNKESHWDYVLRREKGNTVPWILDPVKLKELSPVRKQSSMETDLPSKMTTLAVRASWTDPHWITYNQHQHALLVALTIFDFEGSFQFPFLYKVNGGCGGAPPFVNSDTAHCALFHHNRGGTKKATLGLMREATAVANGHLKPSESLFLRWVYQAQTGDAAWITAVNTALKAGSSGMSDNEIMQLITGEDEQNFPHELAEAVITAPVDDPLMGATLAFMRKQGLVLTKLDVRERIVNDKRWDGLYGGTQMGVLLRLAEVDKKRARSQSMKLLTALIGKGDNLAGTFLDTIPDDREGQMKIFRGYYEAAESTAGFLSSFCFQKEIQFIPAYKVNDFFGDSAKSLLRNSMGATPTSHYEQFSLGPAAEQNLQEAEAWIRSLAVGKFTMPPVGFGTRDSHILLGIRDVIDSISYPIIVIVSNDQRLVNKARSWAHFCYNNERRTAKLLCIGKISVETLLTQAHVKNVERGTLELTNPITRKPFLATKQLEEKMRDGYDKSYPWRWFVFYDEPNICRRIPHLTMEKARGGFELTIRTGGGIPKNCPRVYSKWPSWPITDLSSQRVMAARYTMNRVKPQLVLSSATILSSGFSI